MNLLLDTHALIWAANEPEKLPKAVRAAIEDADNHIWISAVSAIEVAIKFRIGKLEGADELAKRFEIVIAGFGFGQLPITVAHASLAGLLPFEHRDPFDRILIAQAQIEQYSLVSNEKLFDQFGVIRFW
ncbi:type II toxin-antitoxin system VapC family toxin [Sphingopyxis sp. KK2]|uniref:type II toxin-antitoxin system VapC family toxin n=1 Tax=Sphingopyxis sp. KK2 TaxID=1855727 RepID=UPI00097E57E9|nr:type II toxin-antitoxin system VapC family toxin [Sphingopyxis sp. KK2]